MTETSDTALTTRHRAGWPKALIWLAVFGLMLVSSTALQDAGILNAGSSSAQYRPIRTPDAVRSSDDNSMRLVVASMQGLVTPAVMLSRTMVKDAGGTVIGGGDANRETNASATILIPRWPFIGSVHAYGWGVPHGAYRLDVDLGSLPSTIYYMSPTVQRGLVVASVAADRPRIAALFHELLAASQLDDTYDANQLAASAHVGPNWRGGGLVSVAALLPPTPRVNKRGSLTVDIGKDWQIESFSIWTDDTFAYEDATHPNSSGELVPMP